MATGRLTSVVNGMVAYGEGIDCRPKAPATPWANVRLRLACDDDGDEIAYLCPHDTESTLVGAIAEPGEEENNDESESAAHCGESIGSSAIEAQVT